MTLRLVVPGPALRRMWARRSGPHGSDAAAPGPLYQDDARGNGRSFSRLGQELQARKPTHRLGRTERARITHAPQESRLVRIAGFSNP